MKRAIYVFLVSLLIVSACAPKHLSRVEKMVYTSTKTLEAAKAFRETALVAAGMHFKRGMMSEQLKEEIIFVGDNLQQTINELSDMLIVAKRTQTYTPSLNEKMVVYHALYGKFVDIVMPFVLEKI